MLALPIALFVLSDCPDGNLHQPPSAQITFSTDDYL